MHPKPFLTADHQSPFSEIRQMTGYRGLRQVQCLMQMTDTNLARRQKVQHSKPYRISDRLKQFD